MTAILRGFIRYSFIISISFWGQFQFNCKHTTILENNEQKSSFTAKKNTVDTDLPYPRITRINSIHLPSAAFKIFGLQIRRGEAAAL
jgi:hypothetical protein